MLCARLLQDSCFGSRVIITRQQMKMPNHHMDCFLGNTFLLFFSLMDVFSYSTRTFMSKRLLFVTKKRDLKHRLTYIDYWCVVK